MRRPPEVGKAALYLVLLLGASGCAGFPQRTSGSAPWETGSDLGNASPPGLFSWWHRSNTQTGEAPSGPDQMSETAAPSEAPAQITQTATNPWPETQAEWMARNFPRINRLWNGTPAGSPARGTDGNGMTWSNREPVQSTADGMAVTDSDDSGATDGARRTSFQPEDDGANAAPRTARATGAGSSANQSPSAPTALPDILPAPSLAAPPESTTAGGNGSTATSSPAASPGAGGLASDAEPPASLDTRMAQVPPAPPAVQRTPPAPSPSGADQPASSPPAPPASPAASSSGAEKTTGASPAPASPLVAAPTEPATAQTQIPAAVRAQRPFAASGQSVYASPPPMAPAQPRHQLFGWLFHDDDATLASGGAPPAASPTMYSSPQNVLPAGQGNADGCDTTASAPKKPCFLKVWIADWKNSHDGPCASAQSNVTACDSGAAAPKKPCFLKVWIADWKNSHGSGASDCGHGGVCASPQGSAAACETSVKAPKKPCFLKVWIHDWKNSHSSGCGGCSSGGGSSCQGCKCCGGGTAVTGSAQGLVGSPQGPSAQ
jgi:hypothetical protein